MRLAGLILLLALGATRAGADAWPRVEGPGVTVEAPPRFARFARSLVRDHARRMSEVEARLGLAPPARVTIVVAPDASSLASRLGVRLPPWAAGVMTAP